MKTMDCATLETLIDNREPVNLIDIRSNKEFREMHIVGARSLPFATLASPKGFLRYRRTNEQVYVVSDDRVRASLAIGILRASGYMNAMVVEGGMKAWIAQGFPVLSQRITFGSRNALRAVVGLLFIGAGILIVLSKTLIAALVLLCATAILLKGLFTRTSPPESRTASDPAQWRSLSGTEPSPAC